MRNRAINALVALLFLGGLAACSEDSGILDPQGSPQGAELDLMVDEDLSEAVVIDAEAAIEATLGPAAVSGLQGVEGAAPVTAPDPTDVETARALLQEARELFARAREAWANGDTETAAELALQARLKIAEALVLVFGDEAYQRLWERLEHIVVWLRERIDEQDPELLQRIRQLMEEAETIRNEDPASDTNLIRAVERLVLALQIGRREALQMRRQEMAQHARLSVFMATSAVQLAADVAGADATDRQVEVLRHAEHLLKHAIDALQMGRYRLAFSLARESVNVSLVVVMLEPGVDEARVQAMVELSARAIAAAEEALAGQDTATFAARMLEHAKRLQARGNEMALTQPREAVFVLWRAAVLAYGVIRLVT
jgi:HEPN domain-containing protein